jgi:hypothetical protein
MSFSLSTSAFSEFDGDINQDILDSIIDELDLSLVYNSSDYTRFKKEMAHSKNYNDITSGGGTSDNKKSVVFKI